MSETNQNKLDSILIKKSLKRELLDAENLLNHFTKNLSSNLLNDENLIKNNKIIKEDVKQLINNMLINLSDNSNVNIDIEKNSIIFNWENYKDDDKINSIFGFLKSSLNFSQSTIREKKILKLWYIGFDEIKIKFNFDIELDKFLKQLHNKTIEKVNSNIAFIKKQMNYYDFLYELYALLIDENKLFNGAFDYPEKKYNITSQLSLENYQLNLKNISINFTIPIETIEKYKYERKNFGYFEFKPSIIKNNGKLELITNSIVNEVQKLNYLSTNSLPDIENFYNISRIILPQIQNLKEIINIKLSNLSNSYFNIID